MASCIVFDAGKRGTDNGILSTDNCYAMVGQRQGGVLGVLQRALGRAEHHIWFERSEARDRSTVTQILASHVEDHSKLPVLIFPEGTCINNTSVMMFKKGSFEVSSTVYPIAMKYDHRLGDPFWNSSRQGYLAYLVGMMTAWALICDVWYLPAMHKKDGESAIEFARRCQRAIARRGGLVDLGWDGNLKRAMVPERLKREQRELFFHYLTETTPICECGGGGGATNNAAGDTEDEEEEAERNEISSEADDQESGSEERTIEEAVDIVMKNATVMQAEGIATMNESTVSDAEDTMASNGFTVIEADDMGVERNTVPMKEGTVTRSENAVVKNEGTVTEARNTTASRGMDIYNGSNKE